MAAYWQYYLVNEDTWHSAFNDPSEATKRLILAAIAPWGTVTTEQAYLSNTIAELRIFIDQVCRNGISYQNLSESDAELLDTLVIHCLNSKDTKSLLNPIIAHQEGIRPFVLEELLSRSKDIKVGSFFGIGGKLNKGYPAKLVKYVVDGRRVDSETPSDPFSKYFLFSPEEVQKLLEEVNELLNVNRPWSNADLEVAIKDELVSALETARKERLCFAGTFCG